MQDIIVDLTKNTILKDKGSNWEELLDKGSNLEELLDMVMATNRILI